MIASRCPNCGHEFYVGGNVPRKLRPEQIFFLEEMEKLLAGFPDEFGSRVLSALVRSACDSLGYQPYQVGGAIRALRSFGVLERIDVKRGPGAVYRVIMERFAVVYDRYRVSSASSAVSSGGCP